MYLKSPFSVIITYQILLDKAVILEEDEIVEFEVFGRRFESEL